MPRAGLSTDRVVAAAGDVADEVGLDGLTLTAVAERFGVAVPSLYKHVGGLDDLRQRLATVATLELGAALAAVSPDGGLLALATAYRLFARNHPGRYQATVRAPAADDDALITASEQVLTTVFAALRRLAIPETRLVDAARGLRATLHGFVTLEAAGGFGLPRDVDASFEFAIQRLEAGLLS